MASHNRSRVKRKLIGNNYYEASKKAAMLIRKKLLINTLNLYFHTSLSQIISSCFDETEIHQITAVPINEWRKMESNYESRMENRYENRYRVRDPGPWFEGSALH